MIVYFAGYHCPRNHTTPDGRPDICAYLGPDAPPETCPKHGSTLINGYEPIDVDPSKAALGWSHPDQQYDTDLFGGAA